MDVVDKVFFEDTQADGNLIGAYQIFDSPDGKLVLKDLLVQCSWGAQDPTSMEEKDASSILATQRIMWRIKAMLNATPQPEQGEVEDDR